MKWNVLPSTEQTIGSKKGGELVIESHSGSTSSSRGVMLLSGGLIPLALYCLVGGNLSSLVSESISPC